MKSFAKAVLEYKKEESQLVLAIPNFRTREEARVRWSRALVGEVLFPGELYNI